MDGAMKATKEKALMDEILGSTERLNEKAHKAEGLVDAIHVKLLGQRDQSQDSQEVAPPPDGSLHQEIEKLKILEGSLNTTLNVLAGIGDVLGI